MSGLLAHRWGAVFVADCGARNCRIAPDESRVNCPACKAIPADPAKWAERDQFAATLRDVQESRPDEPGDEYDHPPCCQACDGTGYASDEPCSDCMMTGHPHAPENPAPSEVQR